MPDEYRTPDGGIESSPAEGYFSEDACDANAFLHMIRPDPEAPIPHHAAAVEKRVPIYDMGAKRGMLTDSGTRRDIMAEWAHVLRNGAGVFVLKRAYAETAAIDAATDRFKAQIAAEKAETGGGADHFAAAGSNDRIWNALQKLCVADPETYIRYFANPSIDAACEAWLGPNYQMTAQVNLVHPGGAAQEAHRDYHLGFQTAETCATYPAHVHELSPLMTLQGGIAHCDMPVESGPTKLLPYSQRYRPGYAAWRRSDFRAVFEEHCVQLPLEKGDALFFNPALFHAAGANHSADIQRMVNLLQVSSAFGRAMESVDRSRMCETVYTSLAQAWSEGALTLPELDALLAATAEGYSFPTNLDRDPPDSGLAPQSQKDLLKEAILGKWPKGKFSARLAEQERRKRA